MKLKLTGTMGPANSKDNEVSQRLDCIQEALTSLVEHQGSQLKSERAPQPRHNTQKWKSGDVRTKPLQR